MASLKSWLDHNRAYIRAGLNRRGRRRDVPEPAALPREIRESARCCFVLSTGRCGTKLLTHLLEPADGLDAFHVPSPELLYPSKRAYERGESEPETFREVILHARYELVRASYLYDRQYVETNNRITFYAPFLRDAFSGSKFIHLVRHPAAFVRSGLGRRYYAGHEADEGRITPRDDDPLRPGWEELSPAGKIGWLWNATNDFIEKFKAETDPSRVHTVRSEDLFARTDAASRIHEFLGAGRVEPGKIERLIKSPVNAQKSGDVPLYERWSDAEKQELRERSTLAARYDYEL